MAAGDGLVTARFEQGDMRDLGYESTFYALLLLSGSFGFFDDATNLEVLSRMARTLKVDGRVLIDVVPEIEHVIGAQPPAPEVSSAVTWNPASPG